MAMSPALYATNLLNLSERIIAAAHDDGPNELSRLIDQALIIEAPPGIDPAVALVTVLAAQVNPDTTAEQRLGWVRKFGSVPVSATVRAALQAQANTPEHLEASA